MRKKQYLLFLLIMTEIFFSRIIRIIVCIAANSGCVIFPLTLNTIYYSERHINKYIITHNNDNKSFYS